MTVIGSFHSRSRHAGCRAGRPHRASRRGDDLELLALIVGRQAIAFGRGREPALRTDRETFEGHHARGLRDARAQLVDGFEPRCFRAHEPQHHDTIVRHVGQRLERPGPGGVMLEQEAVEVGPAEHLLRNAIVSAQA